MVGSDDVGRMQRSGFYCMKMSTVVGTCIYLLFILYDVYCRKCLLLQVGNFEESIVQVGVYYIKISTVVGKIS